MFKKSILTFCIVLISVLCLTMPCFADSSSYNLLPQNMNSWSSEAVYDTMNPNPVVTFTPARLENRIRFEDTTADHSFMFVRYPSSDLNAQYTLDFDYYGNFSLVNFEVWLSFGGDFSDLSISQNNEIIQVLEVSSQQGSGSSPIHFHYQFVPANFVSSVQNVGIGFGFVRKSGSSGTNLYINNISLKSSNPLDTGQWVGPTIDIDSIDITDYIGGMSDSGGILVDFLTTGFSSVRKGVIGVTSLFTFVWNYLSQYMPAIPYVIVFGLCLGLFGVILSVFKYGKQSGSVSTYHSKGGDRKE